jgi:hypothetical protein
MCSRSSSNPRVANGELFHRRCRAFPNLGLVPATSFIEDDVACHTHALGTLCIPDEDYMSAAIIKLPHLVQLLGVDEAAERAKVRHCRRSPMPHLVRGFALQAFRRRSVKQMNCRHHRLPSTWPATPSASAAPAQWPPRSGSSAQRHCSAAASRGRRSGA